MKHNDFGAFFYTFYTFSLRKKHKNVKNAPHSLCLTMNLAHFLRFLSFLRFSEEKSLGDRWELGPASQTLSPKDFSSEKRKTRKKMNQIHCKTQGRWCIFFTFFTLFP